MNDGHDFYDPEGTGRCQKITGVGHFIEAKPTRCWFTKSQHPEMKSAEQQARDLLERCGVEDAQSFSAGDVVELANLIVKVEEYRRELASIRRR